MTSIFKIQSGITGLYSTGGNDPTFSKKGKVWYQRAHVSSHLAQLSKWGIQKYERDQANVVEIRITEEVIHTSKVQWVLDGIEQRRKQREEDRREFYQQQRDAQERIEYGRLKQKFGDNE